MNGLPHASVLSDFMCRMIGELKRRQNEQKNEDEDWEMSPWSLAIAEQSTETGCEGIQHFPPEVKDELNWVLGHRMRTDGGWMATRSE